MATKPTDLESIVMRLLRERLAIYKNSHDEQIVSNEVIRALRDDIVIEVEKAMVPEKKKSGAFIYTSEASLAESEERKSGIRTKNDSAKPKSV